MDEKKSALNRRNFIKSVTAAGVGSVVGAKASKAEPNNVNDTNAASEKKDDSPKVPRRKLGKTGVEVPVLGLGTMFNVIDNQIMLYKTLQWGANYWDTANSYSNGNSEIGIGKFLKKRPEKRKDVFIVTKSSGARNIKDVEKRLQTSLERMNTDYIDLYYSPHGCNDPSQLTDELKQWVISAKKRKLIRFFGFSTHKNMAKCLMAASQLDWIDVVMPSYNFRLMQDKQMDIAIEACHKAGIGIVAMKTQAKCTAEEITNPMKQFVNSGYTEGQAKIKVVLQDKRISSACVGRGNVAHLNLNIAAVLDKTKLTQAQIEVFQKYAKETCDGYCAGCSEICTEAVPQMPYIAEVMRYLMYYNGYGEHEDARELFAALPEDVRSRLKDIDYSRAEAKCPQQLPIAKLIAEATAKLA